jgi:hypothetical protein
VAPAHSRIDIRGRDEQEATAGALIASAITARDQADQVSSGATFVMPDVPAPAPEERDAERIRETAVTGAADLGAGMIGGTAAYLADQLAEAFAPTPPEVRNAMAVEATKAKAAQAAEQKTNPYMRHIGDAEQKARHEREDQEQQRHWDDERERRRDR